MSQKYKIKSPSEKNS